MPKLSIIIPCYNCENTLEEAVSSCFSQGFKDGELEIVMINDGSTDNTKVVIEKLAKNHSEIRLVFQPKNLGGGAARNIAIKNARANVIFPLDSDDILPDNTLKRMLDFQKEKGCDGVVFNGALVFSQNRLNYKKNVFNIALDRPMEISDVLSHRAWGTGANFLYTKEAYLKSGGYPTHHNFDSQGYGVRFILNGQKAYTCPETFFYQRQFASTYSYFERSYHAGEFSIGHYFILREISHLFNEETKKWLMSFDIFSLSNNILESFVKLAEERNIFIEDWQSYIRPNGRHSIIETTKGQDIVAIESLINNDYQSAAKALLVFLEQTSQKNLIGPYYEIFFDSVKIQQKEARISDINEKLNLMKPTGRKIGLKRANIFKRVWFKILKSLPHE